MILEIFYKLIKFFINFKYSLVHLPKLKFNQNVLDGPKDKPSTRSTPKLMITNPKN